MQRRIQRRRTGRAPISLIFLRVCLWKFWLHNIYKLYCNQHSIFIIYRYFILSSHYKRIGYDWKGNRNNHQTSKNIPRRDTPPHPVLKSLDPPLKWNIRNASSWKRTTEQSQQHSVILFRGDKEHRSSSFWKQRSLIYCHRWLWKNRFQNS